MANMNELIQLMRSLEDQLVVCMRCGMCQAVCPLYAQTGREADVARGKLALLDGLLREMFKDPTGVAERLNKCLLCGSCAANCPSGVNALELFLKARAILTGYTGLPASKKAILRGMLAHPKLLDRVLEWGSRFQGLFTKPVNQVVGTSCARFVTPVLKERHFLPLAAEPFHSQVPSMNSTAGKGALRVAFFVGCLIDKIFPRVAHAVVDVLAHHQVGVFMPAHQGCCGIPALSSGDLPTFQQLMRYNLELFTNERFDYFVTACATCTSTIKKVWPAMAADGDPELQTAVQKLSEKTTDISQFVIDHCGPVGGGETDDTAKAVLTYHDPCHLKKSLGVDAAPRALVQANSQFQFQEMDQPDACCGMGGSFNLQYYSLSSKIGTLKRNQIEVTGCKAVATGCPACMMQISDMLSQAGDNIVVKHAIEIYADGIQANADTV